MQFFRRATKTTESLEARNHRRALVDGLTFEVVPLKGLDDAIVALPPGASVSVTCSPVKGIEATQRITENLLGAGLAPIPHIAARMVRDRAHAHELGAWCKSNGIATMFVVGGDAAEPGDYADGLSFLRDLLDTDHGLTTIGLPAYPDGHALIDRAVIDAALVDKVALVESAGLAPYCSTQMCFNPELIVDWLERVRADGLTADVHLGLPGVVDRTKLMTMGVRLGIGASLSYLRKNRAAVTSMLTSASYDPNDLLVPMSDSLLGLGVAGLHVFTFNQIGATDQWRQDTVAELD